MTVKANRIIRDIAIFHVAISPLIILNGMVNDEINGKYELITTIGLFGDRLTSNQS